MYESGVIPAGVETTDEDTFSMLAIWADVVLCAGNQNTIPGQGWINYLGAKLIQLDQIGADVWGKAMHPELVRKSIVSLKANTHLLNGQTRWPEEVYLSMVDERYAQP